MRAIWSGSISFGLVNIPIKLYSGIEDHSLNLTMLHGKDLSPIRYAKMCKAEEIEVPYDQIVKGYEFQEGNYIALTDEDFKKANLRKTKTIEIVDFVREGEIDSIYFERYYILEPGKEAEKPYALLREALRRSDKVGIARFVIRNREHLGAVKFWDGAIILEQMRFKEEIRNTQGIKIPEADVNKKEVDMAVQLINQLTQPFQPEKFKDTYTEELKAIVEQKAKGLTPSAKGAPPRPTKVPDLMNVLRKSLEREKKGKARSKVNA